MSIHTLLSDFAQCVLNEDTFAPPEEQRAERAATDAAKKKIVDYMAGLEPLNEYVYVVYRGRPKDHVVVAVYTSLDLAETDRDGRREQTEEWAKFFGLDVPSAVATLKWEIERHTLRTVAPVNCKVPL